MNRSTPGSLIHSRSKNGNIRQRRSQYSLTEARAQPQASSSGVSLSTKTPSREFLDKAPSRKKTKERRKQQEFVEMVRSNRAQAALDKANTVSRSGHQSVQPPVRTSGTSGTPPSNKMAAEIRAEIQVIEEEQRALLSSIMDVLVWSGAKIPLSCLPSQAPEAHWDMRRRPSGRAASHLARRGSRPKSYRPSSQVGSGDRSAVLLTSEPEPMSGHQAAPPRVRTNSTPIQDAPSAPAARRSIPGVLSQGKAPASTSQRLPLSSPHAPDVPKMVPFPSHSSPAAAVPAPESTPATTPSRQGTLADSETLLAARAHVIQRYNDRLAVLRSSLRSAQLRERALR